MYVPLAFYILLTSYILHRASYAQPDEVHTLRRENGDLKAELIEKLGVFRHHDDDPDEIAALPESCEDILVKNGCVDAEGVVCDPLEPRFMFSDDPTDVLL